MKKGLTEQHDTAGAAALARHVMDPGSDTRQALALLRDKRRKVRRRGPRYGAHYWLTYGQACGEAYASQCAQRLETASFGQNPSDVAVEPGLDWTQERRALTAFEDRVSLMNTATPAIAAAWHTAYTSLVKRRAAFWFGQLNGPQARGQAQMEFMSVLRILSQSQPIQVFDPAYKNIFCSVFDTHPMAVLTASLEQGYYLHNDFMALEPETVKALIDSDCPIEAGPAFLKHPLLGAVDAGEIDSVRHLINAGADVNAREADSGFTPLHAAAFGSHLAPPGRYRPILSLLLDAGADIEAVDARGKTPLAVAFISFESGAGGTEQRNCARCLIDAGADTGVDINGSDGTGETAQTFIETRCPELVEAAPTLGVHHG